MMAFRNSAEQPSRRAASGLSVCYLGHRRDSTHHMNWHLVILRRAGLTTSSLDSFGEKSTAHARRGLAFGERNTAHFDMVVSFWRGAQQHTP